MDLLKRIVGVLCMIAGPVVVAVLIISAIHNIDLSGKSDIQKGCAIRCRW